MKSSLLFSTLLSITHVIAAGVGLYYFKYSDSLAEDVFFIFVICGNIAGMIAQRQDFNKN